MSNDRSSFTNYRIFITPRSVKFGNATEEIIPGIGDIKVKSPIDNSDMVITNVLFVPDIARKLFSISAITDTDKRVLFDKRSAVILNEHNEKVMEAHRDGNIYKVYLHECLDEGNVAETFSMNDLDLWHVRLGHVNKETILNMSKNNSVIGLQVRETPIDISFRRR